MKRIVIKIGSNIITDAAKGLDLTTINSIASDISAIATEGNEMVIVSSGAVAAGMRKLGLKSRPVEIRLKQAAAAAGQSNLMWAYERSFFDFGKNVAQVLLTREDFADRKRYINARNTMLTLLSYNIIPVINENDTVATDEIRFGDNDNLAALVAISIDADKFFILSDVDGLYDDDPRKNKHARLISCVESITPEIERIAGATGSMVGTGGMYSKVKAAQKAALHGIAVYIMNGKRPGLLLAAVQGHHHGTLVKPFTEKIPQRKKWIAHSSKAKGSLTLDDGAVRALVTGGRSLLPSGIVAVDGPFEIGDAVYCITSDGKRIAKGLVNYGSEDLRKILGKKTTEIEDILGYKYSDEAIHRDNLVII